MESSAKSASSSRPHPPTEFNGHGQFPGAAVLGLGCYAPSRVLSNLDLEQIVETSDDWIVTRTGIRERRIAESQETTADLAFRAAEAALADSGLAAEEIDLILVATVTAERPFPSTACLLQARLGARRAAAMDLGAACAGFIYGMATAAGFIQTGVYRHVLVVGAEKLSRITNWRDRATCVLFGDGAGAVVMGAAAPGAGIMAFELGSDGDGAELLAVNAGGWGHPLTTGEEEERVHSIQMNGAEVFKFAVRVVEESSLRVLRKAGLDVQDIDLFVPHQANIRIIDAAVKRLGIPPERTFNNVQRYGNTSSASIPLALLEAREAGLLEPGARVLLVGFGAGLVWGALLLKWV